MGRPIWRERSFGESVADLDNAGATLSNPKKQATRNEGTSSGGAYQKTTCSLCPVFGEERKTFSIMRNTSLIVFGPICRIGLDSAVLNQRVSDFGSVSGANLLEKRSYRKTDVPTWGMRTESGTGTQNSRDRSKVLLFFVNGCKKQKANRKKRLKKACIAAPELTGLLCIFPSMGLGSSIHRWGKQGQPI